MRHSQGMLPPVATTCETQRLGHMSRETGAGLGCADPLRKRGARTWQAYSEPVRGAGGWTDQCLKLTSRSAIFFYD